MLNDQTAYHPNTFSEYMGPAHRITFSFDLSCQPQMNDCFFFFFEWQVVRVRFFIIFVIMAFCFFLWVGYPKK